MAKDRKRSERRRRALHAARAVTLGLAMAACGESHTPGGDASVATDARVDCEVWWESERCCEEAGGVWDSAGCGIPGPFVPPSMA